MSPLNMKVSKLLEMFKGLKSDAVPRAPRPSGETVPPPAQPDDNNLNGDHEDEQEEEIIIESISDDEIKNEKKSNKGKKRYKSKKSHTEIHDEEEYTKTYEEKRGSASSVNVQSSGIVYNIFNSRGVRLGDDYYFGPVTTTGPKTHKEQQFEEEPIKKDNNIRLLMEATIRPDRDYIDYISKNLGKNWKSFFRLLGYTEGRIETAELDAISRCYSISEARYKLLLEWVNNDDDATLGHLATLLWQQGERSVVKDLSNIYKGKKK